ncbi:hypothetical protein KCU95_g7315, partial [Aureobasidium melanogenum]
MCHVDADLREQFELHRYRILQLRRKCLSRLFEELEILPETTDRDELQVVWDHEWPREIAGHLPSEIRNGNDLYSLITDGTSPPRPQHERLQIFTEMEALLRSRTTQLSDLGPLTLPEDFKELCALTDSLEGPGLPRTDTGIPNAFSGVRGALASLKSAGDHELMKDMTGLWILGYDATVVFFVGELKAPVPGGTWLCWSKRDDHDTWQWRWVTRLGRDGDPHIFEDVKGLLDGYWKTYLSIVYASYGDVGQDALL